MHVLDLKKKNAPQLSERRFREVPSGIKIQYKNE